jgi:hypothetical protein
MTVRLPQKHQAAAGGLVAAGRIVGEFLALDRWQVERNRRIVSHSGCGAGLIREATCRNNDLLRESAERPSQNTLMLDA